MERVRCAERPDWKAKAEAQGFDFHTINDAPYWDETAYYAFTLDQIEADIEDPSGELDGMCRDLVLGIVRDEALLRRLRIPDYAWEMIATSWRLQEPALYGRFDLAYDGVNPAKLLEYNADTPTALYETGYFQWIWLEEAIADGKVPPGSDQFNSVQDKLIETLGAIAKGRVLHLTCMLGSAEDRGTVAYLADCAAQAGLATTVLEVGDIGLTEEGRFVDLQDQPIGLLFKLYPWEWMLADDFGKAIALSRTQFVEPPWKAVVSSKAILPLLWERYPDHPNLLPAFFDDDHAARRLGDSYARKPLYSREGGNITLTREGRVIDEDTGPYGAEGFVRQALTPIPCHDGNHVVLGSWIVGGRPAGLCIREDASPITKNTSRFLPHIILP
jgi:glutathionylspermidine synthase